ncbi:MAG: hypothetical protein ACK4K9_08405 [Bacteroidia bacterium]
MGLKIKDEFDFFLIDKIKINEMLWFKIPQLKTNYETIFEDSIKSINKPILNSSNEREFFYQYFENNIIPFENFNLKQLAYNDSNFILNYNNFLFYKNNRLNLGLLVIIFYKIECKGNYYEISLYPKIDLDRSSKSLSFSETINQNFIDKLKTNFMSELKKIENYLNSIYFDNIDFADDLTNQLLNELIVKYKKFNLD